jgi:hypothetical protein
MDGDGHDDESLYATYVEDQRIFGMVTSGNQKIFQSRMNQNETRCHLPQIHRYSKCFQGTAGCFRVKACTRPQAINMHETSEKSKNIY